MMKTRRSLFTLASSSVLALALGAAPVFADSWGSCGGGSCGGGFLHHGSGGGSSVGGLIGGLVHHVQFLSGRTSKGHSPLRVPHASSSLEISGTPVHNLFFFLMVQGPRDAQDIYHPQHPLQDLAATRFVFIHHACRQAGHSWCDSCLLTPAAIIHGSSSRFSTATRP